MVPVELAGLPPLGEMEFREFLLNLEPLYSLVQGLEDRGHLRLFRVRQEGEEEGVLEAGHKEFLLILLVELRGLLLCQPSAVRGRKEP